MALKVWLPLNGTLENKGISDITVTNNSATFSTNGKTGSKSCNGRFDFTTTPSSDSILNNKDFSVSFGAKINAIPSSTSEATTYILKCGPSSSHTCLHVAIRNTGAMAFCFYSDDYTFLSDVTPYIGIGTHFTFTYSNLTQSAYINGSLVGTRKTSGNLTITNNPPFVVYNNPTQLNDLRIYDHCLSSKEVKEISQGLILHYKLDGGSGGAGENLLKNSNGVIVDKTNNTDGSRTEYFAWNVGDSYTNISTTTTVTISFDLYMKVRDISTYSGQLLVYNTNNAGPVQISNAAYYFKNYYAVGDIINDRISLTTTLVPRANPTKTDNFIEFYTGYGTNNFYKISNVKIELGSSSTPYSQAPTDLGINTTIVPDSSGYGHNGTTTNNPIVTTDSVRYNICTQFNGSNQYIKNDLLMKNNYPTDEITVSGWGYMNSWSSYGRAISCTEGGGGNFEPTGGTMRWAVGTGASSNTYITTCTSTTTLANLTSGWHHFVGTYDGFNAKLYIDGVLEKDITAYTTKTPLFYANVYLYIGCEASATTPYFNGKLSDVRIYATALSTDDILDLYHTPANIDNLNNAHAFEFIDDQNTKIEKTGIFKNRWSEGLELKKLQDGSIGAKLYYFDYDAAGAIWTPQEAKGCNKTAKYSCLGDLEKFVPTDGGYEFGYTEKTDASQYIQGKQSYNPLSRVSSGSGGTSSEYQFIGGTARSNFTGLTRYSNNDENSCYLRGVASWWGAIAPYQTSYDVFPTMGGSSTTGNHHQELGIKITDNKNISRLTANSLSLGMIEK